MYDCSNKVGESCYRLIARNGEFIYLRTTGFLDIDHENQVGSFVCRNTLVSEDEGVYRIRKMKERFDMIIKEESLSTSSDCVVRGPVTEKEMEHAVINMLPHQSEASTSEGESSASIELFPIGNYHNERSLKSPLNYRVPKPETILEPICRSVRVIEASTRRRSDSEDDAVKTRQVFTSNTQNTPASPSSIDKLSTLRRSQAKTEHLGGGKRLPGSQKPISTLPEPMSPPTQQPPQGHKVATTPDLALVKVEPTVARDARVPPLPTSADYFDQSINQPYNNMNSRYLSANAGKPMLKPRFTNPIHNKQRDFCSSVGGFNYHQADTETVKSFNGIESSHSYRPDQMMLKRTHSGDDCNASNFSGSLATADGTELSAKRRVLVTCIGPKTNDTDPQQYILANYEDSGVDHMSDGGSSGNGVQHQMCLFIMCIYCLFLQFDPRSCHRPALVPSKTRNCFSTQTSMTWALATKSPVIRYNFYSQYINIF